MGEKKTKEAAVDLFSNSKIKQANHQYSWRETLQCQYQTTSDVESDSMIKNNFHKAHWQMYYDVKYFSNYLTVL